MKRLLAILLISLAAVAGTFIGTSLANQQTNIPVNNTANNTTANTTVNDDTVKILQEAKSLLQQVKDTLSKKEDGNSISSEQSNTREATIGQEQSIKQESTNTNLNKQVTKQTDTKSIEPVGSSTKPAEQSTKPVKSSTKPVVESNVANTVQPEPVDFASLFVPQKDITIEKIPIEITRNYKEVFKFVMTHPVDESAEQIMLDSLPWVEPALEVQMAANKELYENAKNALSEQDYKLYIWNKLRLEALEYLYPVGQIGQLCIRGLDSPLALDIVQDDDIDSDPDIYGEAQPDPLLEQGEKRKVYKGVEFLLDKRLWILEDFWKPFDEGKTDFGYTTEIRIIGDLSLRYYTDQTIRQLFANYDVEKLITRINQWRKLDWDKIDPNTITEGERIGDLYFTHCIIPNKFLPSLKIEEIIIERYDKNREYFKGKSVDEILKEQGE